LIDLSWKFLLFVTAVCRGCANVKTAIPPLHGELSMTTRWYALLVSTLVTSTLATLPALAGGPRYTPWGPAAPDLDTANSASGGCPIESRDGLTLFTAATRADGFGGLDIWINTRFEVDEPFGPAENLGAPVNTEFDDFCPTPLNDNFLMFVSARPGPGTCGGGDMYIIKRNPAHGWGEPVNLGCAATGDGPNTAGGEFSPSLVNTDEGLFLFFSSNGGGNMDLFVSEFANGRFGPGVRIDELSTADDDRMPNVSKDGREIVFSSNRTEWGDGELPHGGQDVYASWRDSIGEPWSAPVNLGSGINTASDETRSSMSWDRLRLHFGRDGEVYVSERVKSKGRP
jgi:hypothetical protein